MLEIIMYILWTCFAAYAIWYFTAAKHYAPLTPNEARILWKIHRRNIRCDSRRWREIRRGGKTVGFQCECGYRHIQRRPIVANTPTPTIPPPQVSMFEKLHTAHNSA